MNEHILEAIKVIKQGGVVIFPTDTAFGIGCRIDDANAIKRLFTIRKRPQTQATPVLVANFAMAKNYLQEVDEAVLEKLINPFWPGALTVVLPCQVEKIPDLVRGGGDTLGVRMPNHETTLEIITGVGLPILGPSANFHGEQTPYKFEDLNQELVKLVDYVVPGECGPAGMASTVIDCSLEPWKILRAGAIHLSL
jgi:L-threonylcarbamoyladenylate synthase